MIKLTELKKLETTVQMLFTRVGEINMEQGRLSARTLNVKNELETVNGQMVAMNRSAESYQVVVNERIEILAEEMEITV